MVPHDLKKASFDYLTFPPGRRAGVGIIHIVFAATQAEGWGRFLLVSHRMYRTEYSDPQPFGIRPSSCGFSHGAPWTKK